MDLTADQVAWHRMRRSGLIEPFASAPEAAAALLGVQSQFVTPSGLSLRNRLASDFTESDLDRLLHDERVLIRTWGQRNTVHVYSVADWPTFTAATQRLSLFQERYLKHCGGSADDLRDAVVLTGQLLRDRDRACRADLLAAEPSLTAWTQIGNGLMMDLARQGLSCHAGLEGGRSYFAHRDVWLPGLGWDPPSPEAAGISLTSRYFGTYGPATVRDLAFWFGGKMKEAKAWVAALGDELVEVRVGSETLLASAVDLDEIAQEPPPRADWPLRLLHRFDPLVLCHKGKSWLIDERHYKAVWRKAGYVEAVLLMEGRIAGVWRYDKKGKGIDITLEPFEKLPAGIASILEPQALDVADYLGVELRSFKVG
jgi:hypothetical protein